MPIGAEPRAVTLFLETLHLLRDELGVNTTCGASNTSFGLPGRHVKEAGVVLRYIAQARARGLGVIFITHNVHHAYPIGDRFTLLNRGRSYGTFKKSDVSREEVVQMMAGGEELENLSAELAEFTRTDQAT